MARKRYVVTATDEQAIVWGSRVHAIHCRTVEQFLARCADVVCKRLERFDRRMEREEEKRRQARVKERLEREAPFWAAYDAMKKGEG